jgi:uncharacterized protein (DUF4415 family)
MISINPPTSLTSSPRRRKKGKHPKATRTQFRYYTRYYRFTPFAKLESKISEDCSLATKKRETVPIPTVSRIPTTDMEVTSIRLERALKERLKALAGEQGYQALIREILWQYVRQGSRPAEAICARIEATATQDQTCALTGKPIPAQSRMYLGVTASGVLLPLSIASVE